LPLLLEAFQSVASVENLLGILSVVEQRLGWLYHARLGLKTTHNKSTTSRVNFHFYTVLESLVATPIGLKPRLTYRSQYINET
jgi:hypothetical protein